MRDVLKKLTNTSTKTPNNQDTFSLNKKYTTIINKIASATTRKPSSDIILPSDDLICAHVARQSYEPTNTRRKIINNYTLDENNSTPGACIYRDSKEKICILGLRGTVVTQFKDLASDAQIILDIQGIDPRVKDSLNIYDTIKRVYQGYKVWVCGHSLGGTLSYIVAKHRNPERCIVFNPGVGLNTFFFQMLEDTLRKTERAQNTYTYKILGDIVSTAAFVGHTKVFSIKSTDPLKLHAMDNFVQQEVK